MHTGRIVFAQLLDFLPRDEFDKCVRRYRGNHRVRRFSCVDQFLCLAFAQLTYRESLRDIETCLRALEPKLYHAGIRGPVTRSTLADADEMRDWRISPAAGGPPAFPPSVVVAVKALACELPLTRGVPLARWSVAEISGATLWRWLSADANQPWRHSSWIFPRDPAFAEKAGRVLDLYVGVWEGVPLTPREYVLSADEKTSIQARLRRHPSVPPGAHRPRRVEQEYVRGGAWAYLAAWDVRRAQLVGRCEARSGKAAFDRLVAQVMAQEPHRSATRVFWVLDNGSAHRGAKARARLQERWPNVVPVHTPVYASWLNQIETYFSIVQRKVLTPNEFGSLAEVEDRLLRFQERYAQRAKPFQWTFTRQDLAALMAKLQAGEAALPRAA